MSKITSLLVAGGNGYLGRQAIAYFSRQNLKVVAACRNSAERHALQDFLKENSLTVPVLEADLAHEGQVHRLIQEAEQKAGGRLDAVFNAAGAFEMFPTIEADKEHVERLFEANFTSNWILLKHALPAMLRREFGRVVLVSAAATLGPAGGSMGFYVASKAALNALIQSTANEVGGTNVRVNAILPTIIDTPRNRADMPDADFSKWVKAETLLEKVKALFDGSLETANGSLVKVG